MGTIRPAPEDEVGRSRRRHRRRLDREHEHRHGRQQGTMDDARVCGGGLACTVYEVTQIKDNSILVGLGA